MKKIILVVVIATLFVCSFAPAAFADNYTDGYYTWNQPDADWDLQLVVPFDFGANGSVYILADLYRFTGYVVCVENNPSYEHTVIVTGTETGSGVFEDVDFLLIALAGTKVRYAEFQIGLPPSPGNVWLIEIPNEYTEVLIEPNPSDIANTGNYTFEVDKCNMGLYYGVHPLGGLGSAFFDLLRFPGDDVIDDGNATPVLDGVGQAVQGIIGWVGQVIPLIREYPGFIMMIVVPLFVGILTWVTTIYKRRRG